MLSRIWVAVIAASAIGSTSAETVVLRNVHGVTPIQQKGMQTFTGIVIEDGRVKQLLTGKDDAGAIAQATIIDGGGKEVLPGLTDAHGHDRVLSQRCESSQDLRCQVLGEGFAQHRLLALLRQHSRRVVTVVAGDLEWL